MQDAKRNVHPHQTTSGKSMPTGHFDLVKSMRARMACMPGPACSSAPFEEQSQGVEVAVHAAPHSCLFPDAAAATKPQDTAAAAMKTTDDHSKDRSQRPQEGCPSCASDMSSLSSLHDPLPDRLDDFDATLEFSRPSAPLSTAKEAIQEDSKKTEAPSSAAPPATCEAVSQPSQAAAIPGVGWSAKAPSHFGAAKPKLSAKQAEHIRIWSFRDGKVSARREKSHAAERKGKAQAPNPPGAAKALSKKQQAVPQSQQLPQKAPQQPSHQAQLKQPARAQLHAAASAPSDHPAQQRLQPVKNCAPEPQPAPATALSIEIPSRNNAAHQGMYTPAGVPVASYHQLDNMEAPPVYVQEVLAANRQQEGTMDGSLVPEAVKPMSCIAVSSEGNAAAGGPDQPALLACDEVLPETDVPLRPKPRLNMARDLALPQPRLLETAPSVAQKFQDRLTAVISSPGRRSAASSAFIPSAPAPGGSAFSAAAPAQTIGTGPHAPSRSSLQAVRGLSAWEAALEAFCAELSDDDGEKEGFHARRSNSFSHRKAAARVVQRRAGGRQQCKQASSGKRGAALASGSGQPRRRNRAAAPTGHCKEPDFSTSRETESEVAPLEQQLPPPQPRQKRAKSQHAGRAAAAPADPRLPCSRVATFEEVQHWKYGRPQQKKPAAAHRADVGLSPNRMKAVKKLNSGLVSMGRRSLNAHAAVLAAKKKMGRFVIRRSDISGLGVFTLEFCEAGELLMECVGEVVRRPIARMREAAAAARERHDVACYMFGLDADFVVDTTKAGNLARFVNHSCRPNCTASTMNVKGERHIVLIAARQLAPGEELTYDYSLCAPETSGSAAAHTFIQCNCQSPDCLGYI